VSHQPPKNILDAAPKEPMNSKVRYGCQILRDEVLNRIKPLYHIFGHVHEGYGTEKIDNVNFINAATVTKWYKPKNQAIYFELESREGMKNESK